MPKICLCGSYDDREKIYDIGKSLLKDYEVFIPSFYIGRRPTPNEQQNLMAAHFKRIDISDKIVFIFDTKIGVNTLIELGYATALDKEIYIFTNKDLTIPDEFTNYSNYLEWKI